MKRYEREIREILEKMETFVPETPLQHNERSRERELEPEPSSRPVGVTPLPPGPSRTRVSVLLRCNEWLTSRKVSLCFRLMLGGLGLVIVALIINEYLPNLIWAAQLLGGVGAFVFISPVLARFFRGRDLDGGSQNWHGQSVEIDHFSFRSLRNRVNGRHNKSSRDPWSDRNH